MVWGWVEGYGAMDFTPNLKYLAALLKSSEIWLVFPAAF